MATETDLVAVLTPRQIEVLLLIGGEGLTYKAAAARMENKLIKARAGMRQRKISHAPFASTPRRSGRLSAVS